MNSSRGKEKPNIQKDLITLLTNTQITIFIKIQNV